MSVDAGPGRTPGRTLDLARPALEVAPSLLGATLHGRGVSIRITEVEAYLGAEDPGSHAYRGQTRRNSTMFGPAGHLYVYFTYGMHTCANVVCGVEGQPTGLLLRAGEVIAGAELARARRTTSRTASDLARGPARLTVALGITMADDGIALDGDPFRLEAPTEPVEIATGPRVGVAGPGGGPEFPWRFHIPGDPTVSVYRPAKPRARKPRV